MIDTQQKHNIAAIEDAYRNLSMRLGWEKPPIAEPVHLVGIGPSVLRFDIQSGIPGDPDLLEEVRVEVIHPEVPNVPFSSLTVDYREWRDRLLAEVHFSTSPDHQSEGLATGLGLLTGDVIMDVGCLTGNDGSVPKIVTGQIVDAAYGLPTRDGIITARTGWSSQLAKQLDFHPVGGNTWEKEFYI